MPEWLTTAACLHNPSDRLTQREEAEGLYQRWNEQWQRYGYGYWVVRRHGSAVQLGFCGIKPMELGGMKILNLFYRFTPAAWGQGLAGEAATAVVAWASRQVPDLPLVARVRPANVASQRVAIRAGLTRAEHLDTTGDDGVDWIFATTSMPVMAAVMVEAGAPLPYSARELACRQCPYDGRR